LELSKCLQGDTSSGNDNHRSSRRRKAKPDSSKKHPNFLEDLLDPAIEKSMGKPLFQLIRSWINGQTGVDLTYLVWAIALCVPACKYGTEAFIWLNDDVTNLLQLEPHEVLTTDLE
jgi:hypothetical protein